MARLKYFKKKTGLSPWRMIIGYGLLYVRNSAWLANFRKQVNVKRRSGMAELHQFRTGRTEDERHHGEIGKQVSEIKPYGN